MLKYKKIMKRFSNALRNTVVNLLHALNEFGKK